MSKRRRKFRDDPAVRAIREHGFVAVQRAVNFAVAWGYVARQLGHDPSVDEYVEYFGGRSRATVFREQAAFRQVTGLESPRPILDAAAAEGWDVDSERPGEFDGLALLPYIVAKAS